MLHWSRKPKALAAPHETTLGRDCTVLRHTWPLQADPGAAPPQVTVMATRWSAQEAADLARQIASMFPRHGYDKAKGFWWASDGEYHHRILVRRGRWRQAKWIALGGALGAVGVTAIAAALLNRRKSRG